jgi:hypothetical protein
MFSLILIWLCIGMLVGLLVRPACLWPTLRSYGWFTLSVLGSVAALGGGLLGIALCGRFFSSIMALWIAILVTSTS